MFDFGVSIIIFQNTDFKVRYLISFAPTIVAGEGQTLSKCFESIPGTTLKWEHLPELKPLGGLELAYILHIVTVHCVRSLA